MNLILFLTIMYSYSKSVIETNRNKKG